MFSRNSMLWKLYEKGQKKISEIPETSPSNIFSQCSSKGVKISFHS